MDMYTMYILLVQAHKNIHVVSLYILSHLSIKSIED